MKKILYVPLDERPCNHLHPQYIVNTASDVTVVVPPMELLGNKKNPANTDALWAFIFEQANRVDAIVLSVDMLLYGGLLPSRLHHLNKDEALDLIQNFHKLKQTISPDIPLYGFNLIMRTPRYSSSDEEPDYYEQYGAHIFQSAYLLDKEDRIGLSKQEEQELSHITIPEQVLTDYEWRRNFNIEMNVRILELVEAGVIDFLSIPQDDSAEYGYTAQDQNKLHTNIVEKRLQSNVLMYPGADEAGASLLARAYNYLLQRRVKVYPLYSSSHGQFITPLYEDRPIGESLKAHLLVAGCILVPTPEQAHFVLGINSPGRVMQEATDQHNKDITYTSFRQVQFFVDELKTYIENNLPVVLADSAFANGGEIELIEQLDDNKILDQLLSYKGWNTNCNTLGTSIAAGVFGLGSDNKNTIQKNVLYHIFEDVFYQSQVRSYITENTLPSLQANYFDLNNQEEIVEREIEKQLNDLFKATIKHSFKDMPIEKLAVYSPWKRMFEITLHLVVESDQ